MGMFLVNLCSIKVVVLPEAKNSVQPPDSGLGLAGEGMIPACITVLLWFLRPCQYVPQAQPLLEFCGGGSFEIINRRFKLISELYFILLSILDSN